MSQLKLVASICFTLFLSLTACNGSSSETSASETSAAKVNASDYIDVTALGGETTAANTTATRLHFDTPFANLQPTAIAQHTRGDEEFEVVFSQAPNAEKSDADGVGTAFNNNSCVACHNDDGRGNYSQEALEAPNDKWTKLGDNEAIFLRISLDNKKACLPSVDNDFCAPQAVPGFSSQLFHLGVAGLRPEEASSTSGQADVYVKFKRKVMQYADGEKITLSEPVFQIRNPYDSPNEKQGDNNPPVSRLLQADVRTSPRMGMTMIGLGLLEAIPEADILALADPNDNDNDGISGKANFVFDPVKKMAGETDVVSLGRFGWKASTPMAVQSAGAYQGDMGVTNYIFPNESIAGTLQHETYLRNFPADNGQNGAEVSDHIVQDVIFYSSTLSVPARINVNDVKVRKGAELFNQANCTACHTPSFTTGSHKGIPDKNGQTVVELPSVNNQKIFPFTDMLLHDMGDALSDHRSDFLATGREWRTTPLWGIGLTKTVNPAAGFLHDGRAKTLAEAVLWHGGEAKNAKENFRTMPKADRDALIAFLNSL